MYIELTPRHIRRQMIKKATTQKKEKHKTTVKKSREVLNKLTYNKRSTVKYSKQ